LPNIDHKTVLGFGDEWTRFDQSELSAQEKLDLFEMYFHAFPFSERSKTWVGFDAGCGSGRWASLVAPKVNWLHAIDASADALAVARRNLQRHQNCEFHQCSVDQVPLPDESMDFGYSLGVLHHVPDTAAAMASLVKKLKRGAPFLVYIYYAFDNRPLWFRALWRVSDGVRRLISAMPRAIRFQFSQLIAAVVYWPLATAARIGEEMGRDVSHWPLSFYAHRSFYVMRTDALDRFGTRLEQRFTRAQLEKMMVDAGLERVECSDRAPYWCAIGYRA
jgi:ubiquinone/menaquinone biosynthesis C-methylase UbiE